MNIEVKFGLGDKVWAVEYDERYGCISVSCDKINEICVTEDGNLYYIDGFDDNTSEENIIAYEDTDKLVEKLKELTEE